MFNCGCLASSRAAIANQSRATMSQARRDSSVSAAPALRAHLSASSRKSAAREDTGYSPFAPPAYNQASTNGSNEANYLQAIVRYFSVSSYRRPTARARHAQQSLRNTVQWLRFGGVPITNGDVNDPHRWLEYPLNREDALDQRELVDMLSDRPHRQRLAPASWPP